jgi:hypothetical protein
MASVTGDSWNTPKWLADLVGEFCVDPASNKTSHIRAAKRFGPDWGTDGLIEEWSSRALVWCNFPYSKPLPWCERIAAHDGPWVVLCKLDPSTRWYATLMAANPVVAPFRKRIKFEGDKAMTANFPSALVYRAWAPSRELEQHLWTARYV